MRRLTLPVALVALLLGLSGPAPAQSQNASSNHYRWVDARGLPHYSDSLTDEAVKYGYDIINNQGMVVQHVGRQLSPTERVAAQKQAQLQAQQQRDAEDRKRADIQLLNTYSDEDALKAEQQQMLQNIDEQMSTTRINLRSQDAALTDLLNRAADEERTKQPVPKFLTDQITKQRNVVAGERTLLVRQKADRATMVQQQAEELQHYRDLRAAQKADRGY